MADGQLAGGLVTATAERLLTTLCKCRRVPQTPHYEHLVAREKTLDLEVQRRRREFDERPPAAAAIVTEEGPSEVYKTRIMEGLSQRDDAVLITKFGIDFTAKDLRTLQPKTWLNDEVINFYMQLIMERALARPDQLPAVHIFSTFFYPKLKMRGYEAVRSSTRKTSPPAISRDLVLFPIHLGMHWCMAAIRFRDRCISYYDSLHGANYECIRIIRDWLTQESMDKLGQPFDFTGWREECPQDVPAQQNGHDCGVFAIAFAEHLARDRPFTFSQRDMPLLRERIAGEILDGRLLERQ